jgi:hypothetical protein
LEDINEEEIEEEFERETERERSHRIHSHEDREEGAEASRREGDDIIIDLSREQQVSYSQRMMAKRVCVCERERDRSVPNYLRVSVERETIVVGEVFELGMRQTIYLKYFRMFLLYRES